MEKKKPKICVVSISMGSAIVINDFLYNLIEILEPICEKIYIITSNIPKDKTFNKKIKIIDVKTPMHFKNAIHPRWWSTLLQFFKIIIIQIKMCVVLMRILKDIDLALFFLGGAYLFFPTLIAKLFRKKVITSVGGLTSITYRKTYDRRFFSKGGFFPSILCVLEKANFCLSDLILVESAGVTDFLGLYKYRQKLDDRGARFVDINLFRIKKALRERKNVIGYIGRFVEGKGITNFVKAMPLVLEKQDGIKFFLGGSGSLYDKIKKEIMNNEISQKVEMPGWIPQNKIVDYLNELKLFILPSYAEGLPTGVLEAMACGTPVLATPVGGIPDVIKDGETGFITEDNSPKCIAENIIRVLNYPNLEEIAKKARVLIEREYSYDIVVEAYKKILSKEIYLNAS